MNKLTPNLIVDKVEDSLAFWVDRLGFEKTVEVVHEDRLGFVILKRGPLELMLQSRASLQADVAPIAAGAHRAVLYFEVDDLTPLRTALDSWPLVVPERLTPYGARELIVREPAGHVVFFSMHG
jgi:catechol 2,3-dioxygenase-like lactoylglutathione lyase family enzyme